jgi:prevent-host-death family protein
MRRFTMREARQKWADVIDLVRMHGSSVLITRYGSPVAVISPYGAGQTRYGVHLGPTNYTSSSVAGLAERINKHGKHGTAFVLDDGTLKIVINVEGQASETRFYDPSDLVIR